MLWLHLVSWASLCQAAKVQYIPETGNPTQKSILHAAAYNPTDKDIYLFSGRDTNDRALDRFEAFNISMNKWRLVEISGQTKPCNVYSAGRIGAGAFFDNKSQEFYVFGGYINQSLLNDLWKFNVKSRSVSAR
mmetsp:Transcript_28103/g.50323  ORF Transcript_28103/g.50323 Transcript_28103/m.50323 type:complete len:133 (-) Transcript_28103:180-578(-)